MRSFPVTDVVRSYAVTHGSWRPDPVVRQLQAETAKLGDVAGMQIGDDQGQLLTMLARLIGARRAVEVGTFTGYSSMCIARGLAEGGSLLCCDVSAEWTEIGRRAWASAGLADRIELRIAPALDTLRALPAAADIDLVFIDADKPGYIDYYEAVLPKLADEGVILADNTLASGNAIAPNGEMSEAIARFNDHVRADDRVESVLLTIRDGITLIRKR
jgi:caffeoyl-CoA O-methyltransferase